MTAAVFDGSPVAAAGGGGGLAKGCGKGGKKMKKAMR